MFKPIDRGSSMDVQGLICHIPEPGWVFNVATQKIEHRGIFKRSEIKADQYWERTPLPAWYKKNN